MSECPSYTKKDFVSDQEVRWCPGCGDYAIMSSIQNVMPLLGKKREDVCFVSGIGCSSRFPYYMETYGMHTIHGRALAIATGVKAQNPNLSVWVATGDGDALAIGGNHFIHAVRRNIDLNIIIFNNQIYGLTKGQYSPTSKKGAVTKTSPQGSVDHPFNPASVSLGSDATFFARGIDTDPKHMQEILLAAYNHKGVSVVEILQNCVIFNDKGSDRFTNKATRDDTTMKLEHGKPMIFGKNKDKGIVMDGIRPSVVTIGENGVKESDLIVHDAFSTDDVLAFMLSRFNTEAGFPLPLGVFYDSKKTTYDQELQELVDSAIKKSGKGKMQDLLNSGDTWDIK